MAMASLWILQALAAVFLVLGQFPGGLPGGWTPGDSLSGNLADLLSAFLESTGGADALLEDNLDGIIAALPAEVAGPLTTVIETFAPVLTDPMVVKAMVETFVNEMPPEVQQTLNNLVNEVAGGGNGNSTGTNATNPGNPGNPAEALQTLAGSLFASMGQVFQNRSNDTAFIGSLTGNLIRAVNEAVSAGNYTFGINGTGSFPDPLEYVMGMLLDSFGFKWLAKPLLDFFDLDGERVDINLERIRSGNTENRFPMEGPLRTVFLLANGLCYSTLGATTVSELPPPDAALPLTVKDQHLVDHPSLKWWVPAMYLQGVDLLLGTMQLSRTNLHIIVENITEGSMFIVELHVQTIETAATPKDMVFRAVRASVNEGSNMMSDLWFVLGLYEDKIRDSIGRYGVLDWVLKFARLDFTQWLAKKLGLPNATAELPQETAAKGDRVRDELAALVQGLATPDNTTNTMMVYTGLSLGGSVAQLLAMSEKLQCESCNTIALTVNAPGVKDTATRLGLTPADNRPLWRKVLFSWSPLDQEGMPDRFKPLLNFVMQHDFIWKLDKPIPGSSMCMYLHPAESTTCRGITSFKDIYDGLLEARHNCAGRQDWWNYEEDLEDEYKGGETSCTIRRATPVLQCLAQQHTMILSEGLEVTMGDFSALMAKNMTIAMDLIGLFRSSTDVRHYSVSDMQGLGGSTLSLELTEAEMTTRTDERKAKYDEIEAWAAAHFASAADRIGDSQYNDTTPSLPFCNGCPDPWCHEHDVYEERCCADTCSGAEAHKTPCAGADNGETCSGVLRAVGNLGLVCQCMSGYCWDGTQCVADSYYTLRDANGQEETVNAERRKIAQKLMEHLEEERKWAYELRLAKQKPDHFAGDWREYQDVKVDPAHEGKWVCSTASAEPQADQAGGPPGPSPAPSPPMQMVDLAARPSGGGFIVALALCFLFTARQE